MEKNVSLGKQLQFVNLKRLVLTLFLFPPPAPSPERLGRWGRGTLVEVRGGSAATAREERAKPLPAQPRSLKAAEPPAPRSAEPARWAEPVTLRTARLRTQRRRRHNPAHGTASARTDGRSGDGARGAPAACPPSRRRPGAHWGCSPGAPALTPPSRHTVPSEDMGTALSKAVGRAVDSVEPLPRGGPWGGAA